MSAQPFRFGPPKMPADSTCCGKPRGCSRTDDGCLKLRHPWKRAVIYGDTTAPCQKTTADPPMHCRLLHGHDDDCDLVLTPERGRRHVLDS